MQVNIDFKITLPCRIDKPDTVEWLKDRSTYDHNYYHLKEYGDCFWGKCDIIYQVYDECCNSYEYQLGYFEGGHGEFVPMVCWSISEDIFAPIEPLIWGK